MTFDITDIIKALLTLMGTIITAVVIPYIRSKTTKEQQAEIAAWVQIAVTAAEQLFSGRGRGAEKKEYVIEWLEAKGITYDEDIIDALIESKVYELTNGFVIGEAVEITEGAEM